MASCGCPCHRVAHLGVQDLQPLPTQRSLGPLRQGQGLPVFVPSHSRLGERVCLAVQNGFVPGLYQQRLLGATGSLPEGGGCWGRRHRSEARLPFLCPPTPAPGKQPAEARWGIRADHTPEDGTDPGTQGKINQAGMPRTCWVTREKPLALSGPWPP